MNWDVQRQIDEDIAKHPELYEALADVDDE